MKRIDWMKKILEILREKGVYTTDYFMQIVIFYGGSKRTFYRALNDLIFLEIVEQIAPCRYRLAGIENRLREVFSEMVKEQTKLKETV